MTMKNRIKECRQVCGLTQTQLAKYAGWTKEQLGEYEKKLPPIFSEFQSAADTMNVVPAYLVGWSDNPMSQSLEQIAERREDKMHFYHVRSQRLPIDAVIIAESPQQAISVALRHCYDWLPEKAEKALRSQLVAEKVQIEADEWPRWIAGREK